MVHQLLIIDALNLIRRIFAVQQQRHTNTQQSFEATSIALDNAIVRLLQQFKPSHTLAVFDGDQLGWRYQIYPEYKKNRKPMPAELRLRLDDLKQVLWLNGIDSLESKADEADDLIATLACKMARAEQQSCIVSTDLGFCQLLRPGITLYDYFSRAFLDIAYVQHKYELSPSSLCDYWALTGISGLNIKGAKGVGAKRATELLHRFDSLQAIIDSINDENSHLAMLKNQELAIELAKRLVQLKTDLPLGFSLKDIRYQGQHKVSLTKSLV